MFPAAIALHHVQPLPLHVEPPVPEAMALRQDPQEEYQANLRGTRVHSPAQGICIKLSNLG